MTNVFPLTSFGLIFVIIFVYFREFAHEKTKTPIKIQFLKKIISTQLSQFDKTYRLWRYYTTMWTTNSSHVENTFALVYSHSFYLSEFICPHLLHESIESRLRFVFVSLHSDWPMARNGRRCNYLPFLFGFLWRLNKCLGAIWMVICL